MLTYNFVNECQLDGLMGNITFYNWLVVYLPLWKIWKSVGMIIPNIWKIMKFHGSKPPTSDY